jgi:hypothetical protein
MYRIVPGYSDKYGKVWILKEGKQEIDSFLTKEAAEKSKRKLEEFKKVFDKL